MERKWEKMPAPHTNEIMQCDGFSISYNPNPGATIFSFRGDNGCDETALIIEEGGAAKPFYFILNGDFRKEYEAVADDLSKCLEFYDSKKDEHRSSWSGDISNEEFWTHLMAKLTSANTPEV